MTMNPSIKQVYHPYWLWEEQKYNMWGAVKDRMAALEWAIEFTGDNELYGKWMQKVVEDWQYSCEHNLTNKTQNRLAWVGHAACAYANKCPEDIVRKAWGYLTEEQQRLANMQAQKAIEKWEQSYAEKKAWDECAGGSEEQDRAYLSEF